MTLPVPSERAVRDIETSGKWVFGIFQRVLRVAAEQQKHASLIDAQAAQIKERSAQIAALRDDVRNLQAREGELLAKVQAEALKAAGATTSELAHRIGYMEGRMSRE